MKKSFFKFIGVAVAVIICSVVLAFAADSADDGYAVNSDTTWGDLYRYYEPEVFTTLPEAVQMQYDNTLLENQDNREVVSKVTTKSSQFDDNGVEVVSVSGSLYYIGDAEVEERSSKAPINLSGELGLVMSLGSTVSTIGYTQQWQCRE